MERALYYLNIQAHAKLCGNGESARHTTTKGTDLKEMEIL